VGVVIGRPGIGLGTGVGAIGGVGLGDGANLGGNTQQQTPGNPTAGVWQ